MIYTTNYDNSNGALTPDIESILLSQRSLASTYFEIIKAAEYNPSLASYFRVKFIDEDEDFVRPTKLLKYGAISAVIASVIILILTSRLTAMLNCFATIAIPTVIISIIASQHARAFIKAVLYRTITLNPLIRMYVYNHILARIRVLKFYYCTKLATISCENTHYKELKHVFDSLNELSKQLENSRFYVRFVAVTISVFGNISALAWSAYKKPEDYNKLRIQFEKLNGKPISDFDGSVSEVLAWCSLAILIMVVYSVIAIYTAFKRKRELFIYKRYLGLGPSEDNTYRLEKIVFNMLNIKKPREMPVDIITILILTISGIVTILANWPAPEKLTYDNYVILVVYVSLFVGICIVWLRRLKIGLA